MAVATNRRRGSSRDRAEIWTFTNHLVCKRNHLPHFVYVIGCVGDDVSKVGFSNGPFARLKELQAGNHRELFVFGDVEASDVWGARDLERAFHEHFNGRRIVREWFSVRPDSALKFLNENISIGLAPEEFLQRIRWGMER